MHKLRAEGQFLKISELEDSRDYQFRVPCGWCLGGVYIYVYWSCMCQVAYNIQLATSTAIRVYVPLSVCKMQDARCKIQNTNTRYKMQDARCKMHRRSILHGADVGAAANLKKKKKPSLFAVTSSLLTTAKGNAEWNIDYCSTCTCPHLQSSGALVGAGN